MKFEINEDKVSKDRWEKAQSWEEAHWVRTQQLRGRYFKNFIWKTLHLLGRVPKHRGDDWNQWWKKQFDDYKFLPARLGNVIEVGKWGQCANLDRIHLCPIFAACHGACVSNFPAPFTT